MGLDMYLEKEHYIGAKYAHRNVKGNIDITIGENNTPIKIDFNRVSTIVEEVAYWRKANHIHQWFVEEVQNGVDECQRSWISYEKLMELVKLCEQVVELLDDNDIVTVTRKDSFSGKDYEVEVYANVEEVKQLLSPTEGFFFGSTEIDKWYKEDCLDTIKQLKDIDPSGTYYYQASW